jgi:hypothetical protein
LYENQDNLEQIKYKKMSHQDSSIKSILFALLANLVIAITKTATNHAHGYQDKLPWDILTLDKYKMN